MKRIFAVVVMRKDRELKPEEDHIPDRQQSKRNGPYDLITSFPKRVLYIIFDFKLLPGAARHQAARHDWCDRTWIPII